MGIEEINTDTVWYHVIWNTLGSWLPGDPRGFRNRDHRIHSSGDYKNPPPAGEHEGLLRYNQKRARAEVTIPYALRPVIGDAARDAMTRRAIEFVVISVSSEHVHVLGNLPRIYSTSQALVGKVKTIASLAVREQLPGSIWSRGCMLKPITSPGHWASTQNYIANMQERGAYVWDRARGAYYMT